MNARQLYYLTMLNLRLMRRNSVILSICIPVGLFVALLTWATQRFLLPPGTLLMWTAVITYIAGQHLIIRSRAGVEEETDHLCPFPLDLPVIILARQLASAAVLLFIILASMLCLAAVIRPSYSDVFRGILFVGCSLPPLVIIGWLPIWPANNDLDAPIITAGLFAVSIGISSLPYYIAMHVLRHEGWCLVWMIGFFAVWKDFIVPKCAAWTSVRIFRSEAP